MTDLTRPWRMPPRGGDPAQVAAHIQHCLRTAKDLRHAWLKQVEQNIRFLAGQQYAFYSEALGRYVNLEEFIGSEERWRQQPVFNELRKYYDVTLSKFTENLPVLTALPAGSDEVDAKTAEIFDPVYRYEWDQMDMIELNYPLYGWILTAGRGVLMIEWDADRGDSEEWVAPGLLPNGQQADAVPYIPGPDGRPMVNAQMDEMGGLSFGQPHRQPVGDLKATAPPPTSIILPFGPEPAHRKPWMIHEYWEHVDILAKKYGKQLEPDVAQGDDDLLGMLGYADPFGMPSSLAREMSLGQPKALDGMVKCRARWAIDEPQGRLTILAKDNVVLMDEINPWVVPGVQDRPIRPIYIFDRVGYPFRQQGNTDLEVMNPIQAAGNRYKGNLMDAADHYAHPPTVYSKTALGDVDEERFNKPGEVFGADVWNGSDPIWRMQNTNLPANSAEMSALLERALAKAGNMDHMVGDLKLSDPSGELLRQMRFDVDRPLGSTLRLHSYVHARIGADLIGMLSVGVTEDRLLTMAGEDQAWTMISIGPELFRGRINVRAMPESGVLETRQDKQSRIAQAFTVAAELGATSPALAEQFLKTMSYPDVNRALRPGGEAYATAQRDLADMWRTGIPALVWPEQDHQVCLKAVTDAMQGRRFRDAPPEVQQAFRIYRQMHQAAGAMQAIEQAANATMVAAAQTKLMEKAMPTPPPEAEGESSERGRPTRPAQSSGGTRPQRVA